MTIDYTTTPNYGLDKYGDKSPADLRDGHNHNMDIIDQALRNNSDAIAKKADRDSVYTKDETDGLLSERDTNIQKNSNSIDSLGKTVESNKAEQAQKDAQQDDNAKKIQTNLNTLGDTVSKNAQKETSDIADLDARKADKTVHNIICLGDSWGQAWQNGNHPENSPFNNMKINLQGYWNVGRFENHSVSASGFIPNGDSKNFIGQWSDTSDRENVTDVVILGGQNDAAANDNEQDLKNAFSTLCNTIAKETNNRAKIWVFWFPLAAGQKMMGNTGTSLHKRASIYPALYDADKPTFNSRIFRGCYRWGDWLEETQSLGDGAHLTPGGYSDIGWMMGKCILHNIDLWPEHAEASIMSEISGTWRYDEIIEKNGFVTLSWCVDYNVKPNNGDVVIKLPAWATSNVARFCPNFSGSVFFSLDGDAVRVQNNSDLAPKGTLAGTMTFPAGY